MFSKASEEKKVAPTTVEEGKAAAPGKGEKISKEEALKKKGPEEPEQLDVTLSYLIR